MITKYNTVVFRQTNEYETFLKLCPRSTQVPQAINFCTGLNVKVLGTWDFMIENLKALHKFFLDHSLALYKRRRGSQQTSLKTNEL